MNHFRNLGRWLYDSDWSNHGKWFFLSTLVGLFAGLGAIGFQYLTQLVTHFALGAVAGYTPGEPVGEHAIFEGSWQSFYPLVIPVVAIGGGLLSGALVFLFAPEAEGHGTDAVIDSFHNKRGVIRPLVPIIKTIASAITIGTGGSGGREGPIAQIGAGFASFFAERLMLTPRDRRILIAAGMAAGVGAIFRAPLAGALFAAEILYSDTDFEADVIIPSAIAAVVAYATFCLSLPVESRYLPLFGEALRDYQLNSLWEMGLYLVLAFVLSALVVGYVRIFYGIHSLFKRLPIFPHFKPAIGVGIAAVIGVAMYFVFQEDRHALAVLSTGYGALQDTLVETSSIGIPLLVSIALVKIVTTSFTISSGGSGGVFGPSMVIGGCAGGAVGQWFHSLWPKVVQQPEAYALVGMAGFFAGAANAPISTVVMVAEMTGNYALLLPTMLVSAICYMICRKTKLYQKQVPSRLESAAHRGDFVIDMLEGFKVEEVYRKRNESLIVLGESSPLETIVHLLAETHQHYFPVANAKGQMVGIFTDDDVRAYLYDKSIWTLAVANDIMTINYVSLFPDDDLNTAMKRFADRNLDELPVISNDEDRVLLGMLRRKEIIAFYNQRLMQHKQDLD